jgi:hypothetical protein
MGVETRRGLRSGRVGASLSADDPIGTSHASIAKGREMIVTAELTAPSQGLAPDVVIKPTAAAKTAYNATTVTIRRLRRRRAVAGARPARRSRSTAPLSVNQSLDKRDVARVLESEANSHWHTRPK